MRAGTIFDNFLITDDEQYAEDFGDDTWGETKVMDELFLPPRPLFAGKRAGVVQTGPKNLCI